MPGKDPNLTIPGVLSVRLHVHVGAVIRGSGGAGCAGGSCDVEDQEPPDLDPELEEQTQEPDIIKGKKVCAQPVAGSRDGSLSRYSSHLLCKINSGCWKEWGN